MEYIILGSILVFLAILTFGLLRINQKFSELSRKIEEKKVSIGEKRTVTSIPEKSKSQNVNYSISPKSQGKINENDNRSHNIVSGEAKTVALDSKGELTEVEFKIKL